MSKDFNFFDSLDDTPPSNRPLRRALTPEQHRERASIANGGETDYHQVDCPRCGGRGYKTYGYVNITHYPCKMCKETGKVTQRRIKAVEAAKKARATAANNLAERLAAFNAEHRAEVEFIGKQAERSDFYRSLRDQLAERGTLSEKQLATVQGGMAKDAARRAEWQAQREAAAPTVDLSTIHKMFETALASGLKRLAYRAKGLVISPAGASSANPGALYVKTAGGTYIGKVVNSKFMCVREATDEHRAAVIAIAVDPSRVARDYGKETGQCCCCGRELTDPKSIEDGIGPICAEKWGL